MKIKLYKEMLFLSIFTYVYGVKAQNYNKDYDYSLAFKNKTLKSCDAILKKIEEKTDCSNMICRDLLINAWADCLKYSMNAELDRRLLKLKNEDKIEFHKEMELQKKFNAATHMICTQQCGGGMKGISQNFCRANAYKYRINQAIQMNKNRLSIPTNEYFLLKKKRRDKIKFTAQYKSFIVQLCDMPKKVWLNGMQPSDCQKKAFQELDNLEFTDDVCDLS